jgi:hypothetical protein
MISTESTAVAETLPIAALALSQTGNGITLSGTITLGSPGNHTCSLGSNAASSASINLNGNVVSGRSSYCHGGFATGGPAPDAENPVIAGAPPVADPTSNGLATSQYQTAIETDIANGALNNCTNTLPQNSPDGYTAVPGCYSGFNVTGNVALSPGVYYVSDGNLSVPSGASLSGTGVVIVLTSADGMYASVGNINLSNGATVSLTGYSSNTVETGYDGAVIVQDNRASSGSGLVEPGATSNLSGIVYTPSTSLAFQGSPIAGGPACLMTIAASINFDGNTTLDTTGCNSSNFGPASPGGISGSAAQGRICHLVANH